MVSPPQLCLLQSAHLVLTNGQKRLYIMFLLRGSPDLNIKTFSTSSLVQRHKL